MDNISTLISRLKPDIIGIIQELGLTTSSTDSSGNTTDVLNASQYPDALLRDGTRSLLGSLLVAVGATIDGVDLDVFKSNMDSHLGDDAVTAHGIDTGAGIITSGTQIQVNQGYPFVWTANHEAQNISPRTNDQYDLGEAARRWRQVFASELETILLKYKAVIAVDGQIILGKQNGTFAANVSTGATTINFGQAMTVGDFIYIAGNNAVEYVQVGSLVSGTTYNVTRNIDGSGADAWVEGQAWICFGQSGDLRLVLEGGSNNTPKISLLQQGTTYNATTKVVGLDVNGLTFAITEYTYNLLRWYVGANQAGSIGFGALGTIGVPTTQRVGHFYTMEHNDATKLTGLVAGTDTGAGTVSLVARNTTVLSGKSNGAITMGGTSFPPSPADNDLYYRTDRDIHYVYNATIGKWLSVQQFPCPLFEPMVLQPWNATSIGTTNTTVANYFVEVKGQNIYLEGYANIFLVGTNNATNYFNYTLQVAQNGGGGSPLVLLNGNTSAMSAGVNNVVTATAGEFTAITQGGILQLILSRALTPGQISFRPYITYRKVG